MLYHLDVKTTTFVDRHLELFQHVANDVLDPARFERMRILEVGPGMALRGMGRYNDVGSWRPVKRLETVVRRLPLPVWCYENYETAEILNVFRNFSPQLTVADISRKSLDVIRYNLGQRLEGTVELDLTDIGEDTQTKMQDGFDLVICLATFARIPPKLHAQAARNLASFCAPSGIVIVDRNIASAGLEPVVGCKSVFFKPANSHDG